MSEKLSLPSCSYPELAKIIQGYGHNSGDVALDDLAKLVGIGRTGVSGNNKFLAEVGLIQGGKKKSATSLGTQLGRALEFDRHTDISGAWRSAVSQNETLASLVTTVRIKGGCQKRIFHRTSSMSRDKTRQVQTGPVLGQSPKYLLWRGC